MVHSFWFMLFTIGISTNAENVQINIAKGPILGRVAYTYGLNKLMYMFQGIPYAEVPVRFELPVEKATWTDVINCTYDKPQCVQQSDPVLGSEDCLTLSVYSPNITGIYPVLVWIHGGYFAEGNASYVSVAPDYFIDEGTVFVAIQYRVGVFGFLSTEDSVCPGNLGFKDQVLALKWVQNNIKYFGGDPTRVTLGGQSAGSVAVSLHLQSPLSAGLFNATILESGTSLNLWGLNRRAKETANDIGVILGVSTLSSEELIAGLKTKNYTDLQEASVTASTAQTLKNPLAGIYYGYVPETDGPNAFINGKSEAKLYVGNFTKVPMLLGINSNEAIFFGNITALVRLYFLTYDLAPTRLIPADLGMSILTIPLTVGNLIKTYFFGALSLISFSDDNLVSFVSSDQFDRPIWEFGLEVSKYVDQTYFYQFSYEGALGGVTYRTYDGVGHAEELNYLLIPIQNKNVSSADILTMNRTVRLWCNFIKYWNPTPKADPLLQNQTWLPLRYGNVNGTNYYFNINTTLQTLTNLKRDTIQFWNNPSTGIYPVYGSGLGTYDSY